MSAQTVSIQAPAPVVRARVPLAMVVAIACVSQFMVVLDSAIVNVALPAMRTDLQLSVSEQQWIVDIYLLTFGGFLLLAARAGDLFGRRGVFQFGLILFTVASLAGGLATNGPMLLTARAVQGLGAAALAPSTLSLITSTHHDGQRRSRALALWSASSASSAAAGVVLGGVLTNELNWRWVFWVNVPVGALVIAGVALTLLPGTRTVPRPRLDLPGAFTVTLAMTALVYGISQATEVGWLAGQVVGSLVGSVLLFVVFVIIESRVGQPLVRLNIFRLRGVRMGNLVMLCLGATLTATLYLLALYFEHVLGYTALRAGLGLLPMAAALCAGALTARRLLAAGVRHLPTGGTVLTIAGFALLTRLPAHTAYLSHVLAPTLLLGAGFAGMILPVVTATTSGIAPADAGLAAGLVNVARQVGGALGLAILVTIATSVRHRGSTLSLAGYHAAFAAAAVINLLATGAAIVLDHVPDAAAAR